MNLAMMIYLFIGIAVVCVVLFLLFVPLRVIALFESKSYTLSLKVCGITIDLKKLISGKKKKKKSPPPNENQENGDKQEKKLIQKINDIYQKVIYLKNVYNASSKTVSRHFVVENIGVNFSFGTSDAALTGMLTGTVWALLYEMLGVLSLLSTVKNHKFNVDSVYDRFVFELTADAVFKINVYGALCIAISVLYNLKKQNHKNS